MVLDYNNAEFATCGLRCEMIKDKGKCTLLSTILSVEDVGKINFITESRD